MSAPLIGITTRTTTLMGQVLAVRAQALSEHYVAAVAKSGGLPVLIPSCLPPDVAVGIAERLDGLIVSGGPDVHPLHFSEEPKPGLGLVDPPRDEMEMAIVRMAVDKGLPLFGICRGMQVMNVAMGGTLIQDLPTDGKAVQHDVQVYTDGPGHTVGVRPGSLLSRIVGTSRFSVNSSHHQAVQRLGKALVPSATAADGVVEAMERADRKFLLAVQWHPERSFDRAADAAALFKAFVEACRP